MRFVVLGAGAMGSLVGGLLSRAHAVTLVGRRAHVEAIRAGGLSIQGHTELLAPVAAVEDPSEAARPDVVIVTVKSPDTAGATSRLRALWPDALLLSLQNGLGNAEALAQGGDTRVLAGVTYHGVTFDGPGLITHAGTGETLVGPFQRADLGQAVEVAAAFSDAGLPARALPDITHTLWAKAALNACFNPLTGLLRLRSGAVGESAPLLECCEAVLEEAVAVAAAHGVTLEREALMERVRAVSRATAQNRSSMLQDLERARPTEIDAINGAIWRMGEAKGLPCPVNRLLTLLVKAAEERGAGGTPLLPVSRSSPR